MTLYWQPASPASGASARTTSIFTASATSCFESKLQALAPPRAGPLLVLDEEEISSRPISWTFCFTRWPMYQRPATPSAANTKITTTKATSTLMSVLPDLAGAAAAIGGAAEGAVGGCCAGAPAFGVGGAAEGRTGGPAAGVPQPAQKPCASANGLPQFLQKPAIDASPGLIVR